MNPIIFYSIMAAVVFIAVYSLFITKEKPKKETPDLQSNTKHDNLNDVLARDSKEKIMGDKIADLSGKLNAALAEISVCNNLIKNKERIITLKDMEINALKERFKEDVKVGDVVCGYVIPHGKNQSTGKVVRITRRGNYLLDNGKTVKLN
jgi:hypothetical protein